MNGWALALRLARRDFRGGLKGFAVVLLCLALGVGAIAGIGQVSEAIQQGLRADSRAILGGDLSASVRHRAFTPEETAILEREAVASSRYVEVRAMIVFGEERSLAAVKGVDAAYPLVGDFVSEPPEQLPRLFLDSVDGAPGLLLEPSLAERLGMKPGDFARLGTQRVRLTGYVGDEPDKDLGGFDAAPRALVSLPTLEASGLLQPGGLYVSTLNLSLPPGAEAQAARVALEREFSASELRVRDPSQAASSVRRFVENLGSFLALAGLAALGVGGVGVAAATRAHLERKTASIATLKTVGASSGLVARIYLLQIAFVALIGVGAGLLLGALTPWALGGILRESLPIPADFRVYLRPLFEAAVYGLLTAALFALWPLGQAEATPPARLYRATVEERPIRPGWRWIAATCGALALIVGCAAVFSASPRTAMGFLFGIGAAFLLLRLAAWALAKTARRLGRSRITRGRPALRLALAAAGGPGGETTGVALSLGIGLTLMATLGLVEANLRHVVEQEIPREAPAFFFLDIPAADGERFEREAAALPGVTRVDRAPMLRGRLVALNGERLTAANTPEAARWLIRGDRGLTYADQAPEDAKLTEGAWWSADYAGEPLVSFAAREGQELGLKIGDQIEVNVLGRPLRARVANFREVDWRGFGMNFVMVFNGAALRSAPHSHLATLYAPPEAEAGVLRALGASHPNAAAVGVREAVGRAVSALDRLTLGLRAAAAAVLLAGLAVLAGAVSAGQRQRLYEAAALKAAGAERSLLLRAFALRFLLTGAAAGLVAFGAAWAGAWAVMRFVMEQPFQNAPGVALFVILGGALLTLAAGAVFVWRALAARPARVLRTQDG